VTEFMQLCLAFFSYYIRTDELTNSDFIGVPQKWEMA